jgi:hypothetical protein
MVAKRDAPSLDLGRQFAQSALCAAAGSLRPYLCDLVLQSPDFGFVLMQVKFSAPDARRAAHSGHQVVEHFRLRENPST